VTLPGQWGSDRCKELQGQLIAGHRARSCGPVVALSRWIPLVLSSAVYPVPEKYVTLVADFQLQFGR